MQFWVGLIDTQVHSNFHEYKFVVKFEPIPYNAVLVWSEICWRSTLFEEQVLTNDVWDQENVKILGYYWHK